ncbi:MAG: peroxiredoxin Q/BCP [Candidatus Azotimanducaceae bacterium]|jgi:peroxiredoxin Q/BCP
MKQLVELQAHRDKFEAEGIGLVVVTYDAEEDQQRFVDKYGIGFPLVSDIEITTVRNMGILNEQIESDSEVYGIPYPGFFVLDNNGTIRARSFLEGYQKRLDASTVLRMVDTALTE